MANEQIVHVPKRLISDPTLTDTAKILGCLLYTNRSINWDVEDLKLYLGVDFQTFKNAHHELLDADYLIFEDDLPNAKYLIDPFPTHEMSMIYSTDPDNNYYMFQGTKQGVYFLFSNKQIVYIGSSQHIKSRLKDHYMSRGKEVNHFDFIPTPDLSRKEMVDLEDWYIAQFRPKWNQLIRYKQNAVQICDRWYVFTGEHTDE